MRLQARHSIARAPMTDPLVHALRAGRLPPQAPAPARAATVLVAGAGGMLGAAVLAEALGAGRFGRVLALVAGPLKSTMRGLVPVRLAELRAPRGHGGGPPELAYVVFERRRASNGRDDAFVMPEPADLVPLARALHAAGVTGLVVVLPHSPALLPHALKHGFASHEEEELAGLGFRQLVFVRSPQDASAASGGSRLERFAAWWLSQLRWMVPVREQALRAPVLARVLVALGRPLMGAPPATRVAPPELLWLAAQPESDAEAVFDAWLHGRPWPGEGRLRTPQPRW